jgi:hypothetical protein
MTPQTQIEAPFRTDISLFRIDNPFPDKHAWRHDRTTAKKRCLDLHHHESVRGDVFAHRHTAIDHDDRAASNRIFRKVARRRAEAV